MTIPEWDECQPPEGNAPDERTPLEKFVYNNEPANGDEAEQFRKELHEALVWAEENSYGRTPV